MTVRLVVMTALPTSRQPGRSPHHRRAQLARVAGNFTRPRQALAHAARQVRTGLRRVASTLAENGTRPETVCGLVAQTPVRLSPRAHANASWHGATPSSREKPLRTSPRPAPLQQAGRAELSRLGGLLGRVSRECRRRTTPVTLAAARAREHYPPGSDRRRRGPPHSAAVAPRGTFPSGGRRLGSPARDVAARRENASAARCAAAS